MDPVCCHSFSSSNIDTQNWIRWTNENRVATKYFWRCTWSQNLEIFKIRESVRRGKEINTHTTPFGTSLKLGSFEYFKTLIFKVGKMWSLFVNFIYKRKIWEKKYKKKRVDLLVVWFDICGGSKSQVGGAGGQPLPVGTNQGRTPTTVTTGVGCAHAAACGSFDVDGRGGRRRWRHIPQGLRPLA